MYLCGEYIYVINNGMIGIDELRKIHKRIVYHPLGAIRVTFGEDNENVYHFYSDKTPMLNTENIHNHPYSFKSTILRGCLRNIIYDYTVTDEAADHRMFTRGCWKGAPLTVVHDNVEVTKTLTFETNENDSYYIHCSVLHKIESVTPKLITLLEKGPVEHEPSFIWHQGVGFTEGQQFGLKSEKECWEIVEYTLQ